MAPLRYLLIDLDGTLLGIDMAVFSAPFISLVGEFLAPFVAPYRSRRALQEGFRAIAAGRDGLLLSEVFAEQFGKVASLPPDRVGALFGQFYRGPFEQLRSFSNRLGGARPLIDLARGRGLRIVLATKPVFPREAIAERIAWAGLVPGDFDLVTTSDNMRTCKPAAGYWREVLDRIGAAPDECLMAGNDRRQDLSAAAVGIPVFLVDEGFVVDDPVGTWLDAERGTLADLADRLSAAAPPEA